MNVDSIKITSEEDGFHLIIDGDSPCDGYSASILDFNIHSVAVDLLAAVERTIAPWHREGMSVLAEMKAAGAFACGPDDVDESGGYDPTDPKHPDWHSIHADLYDNREGK